MEDPPPQRRITDLFAIQERAINETPRGIDVRALRKRMGLTQRQFAGYFGFPVATLRHWEHGNRRPTGTALVLLHVIADNPRAVLVAVRKARMTWPLAIPPMRQLSLSRAPPGYGNRG